MSLSEIDKQIVAARVVARREREDADWPGEYQPVRLPWPPGSDT